MQNCKSIKAKGININFFMSSLNFFKLWTCNNTQLLKILITPEGKSKQLHFRFSITTNCESIIYPKLFAKGDVMAMVGSFQNPQNDNNASLSIIFK